MKRNANTATKPVPVTADCTAWTFTATTAALNGHVFPARYDVAKNGDVYVLATVEGVGVRIHVGKASPVYHDALMTATAAKAAKQPEPKAAEPAAEPAKPEPKPTEQAAKQPEPKAAEPAKQAKPAAKRKAAKAAKQPEPKAAEPAAEPAKPEPKATEQAAKQPEPAAEPAKQAKPATKRKAAKAAKQPEPKAAEPAQPASQAANPDKPWIGTAIEGKGWRIAFDATAQRTRVITDADPSAEQKAAIEAAGFFWSATTKSWNKKLTCKAHRAALALADALNALA